MKSKPIGVRFDQEKLELIKKDQNLSSPQKVVNWLMDNYANQKSVTETEKTPHQRYTVSGMVIIDHGEQKLKPEYNPFDNPRFNKKL